MHNLVLAKLLSWVDFLSLKQNSKKELNFDTYYFDKYDNMINTVINNCKKYGTETKSGKFYISREKVYYRTSTKNHIKPEVYKTVIIWFFLI